MASKRANVLVEQEYVLTAEDFRRIAEVLYADAGIALTESKADLVYSRLARRLRKLGLETFRDYCGLIQSSDGLDERQAMLAALTTNVTRFFREPHHFDDLRNRVMPILAERARKGGRVRLWSAACSSGQEPYCMAMTVLETLPEAADLDVRILATDIDPNILAEARRGEYSEDLLAQVPPALLSKSFDRPEGGRRRVADRVRDLVSFRELNLIGDWPMRRKFDVIFCRNVAIYFDEPTQQTLWSRFADVTTDGAMLYIGHSERVSGKAANSFQSSGLTAYRRVTP